MEKSGHKDFSFAIETPDGIIPEMQVKIPENPIVLSDLVPFMHSLADAIIDLAIKKNSRLDEKVTCRPGCGICCCQLIPLSAPEVFFMVDRLLEMPFHDRARILKRFETIENRIIATGLMQQIGSIAEADTAAVAGAYFHLEEPCPFLKEQSCSIHAWRPVVCREFNALSDPALCADPFVNKIRTIPLFKRPSSALALLASKVSGIPAGLVPMPLLFDWYQNNQDLKNRTWPAEMLIKKLLETIVEPGKKRTADRSS